MLIVEYWTDGPLLRDALAQAPAIEISIEEQYVDGEAASYIFWASGGDFTAFEVGLEADSSLTDVKSLAETQSRRLLSVYRPHASRPRILSATPSCPVP